MMKRRAISCILTLCLICLTGCRMSIPTDYSETYGRASSSTNTSKKTSAKAKKISTAADYKNMKVGDIGEIDNLYVGLSYVKRMDALTTIGTFADANTYAASKGSEIIVAFFDFYNLSGESTNIIIQNATCYADGFQIDEADNHYDKVVIDGIKQITFGVLDDGTQMLTLLALEVPIGWGEIKIFYESKCVWTVTQADVKNDSFSFKSMYNEDISRTPTKEKSIVSSGKCDIVYDGYGVYKYTDFHEGDVYLAVFMFTFTNTGTSSYYVDGYAMRAYGDNYLMDDPYTKIEDKIDGYSNAFSILNNIEVGMSARVYYAFKLNKGAVPQGIYIVHDGSTFSTSVDGSLYVEIGK